LVSILTFLEGVLDSLDFGHVGGSSGINIAFSSLRAPGPSLQRLDVRLLFDPRAPYAASLTPRLRFASM
jgi:hypothetical protein